MTKQEEKDVLTRLVTSLPRDSYLWDIFTGGLAAEIDAAITNDLGFVSIAEQRRNQDQYEKEIASRKAEAKKLEELNRQAARTLQKAKDDLAEVRAIAQRLAAIR